MNLEGTIFKSMQVKSPLTTQLCKNVGEVWFRKHKTTSLHGLELN